MRRFALPTLALVLAFVLVGCKGQATPTAGALRGAGGPGGTTSGALPEMTMLVVGTFRLEGTDQAVTTEQAKQLALLWRGYRTLISSDSVAPQELAGVEKQLREAMTADQLKAIDAMNLTAQDVMAVMSEQGVQAGAAGSTELSEEEQARIQMLRQAGNAGRSGGQGGFGQGGGMPGGGMPGGMPPSGGFPGGGAPGGEMGAGPAAQGEGAGGAPGGPGMMVSSALLDKLIAMLEAK